MKQKSMSLKHMTARINRVTGLGWWRTVFVCCPIDEHIWPPCRVARPGHLLGQMPAAIILFPPGLSERWPERWRVPARQSPSARARSWPKAQLLRHGVIVVALPVPAVTLAAVTSVAVTVSGPVVPKETEKVPVPFTRAASAGRVAAVSLLVRCTVSTQ